jgi:hypothetical protein
MRVVGRSGSFILFSIENNRIAKGVLGQAR